MIWTILEILAAILLAIYFFRRRNSIWGGLTIGAIAGFIIAVISAFMGKGFSWHIIIEVTTVGIILGFIAELLGKISDFY